MTIYNNEPLVLILKDERVVRCFPNGYSQRTLYSPGGQSCSDTKDNNYGIDYWKKQAMKHLNFNRDDIVLQVKGNLAFMDRCY